MTHDTPAFPSHGSMGEVTYEGLTKREFAAIEALQGLLSAISHPDLKPFVYKPDGMAKEAVILADALLLELSREKKEGSA